MNKTKITKIELQKLLKKADHLSAQMQREWIDLSEDMNQEEIEQSYEHFMKQKKRETDIKLQLITKHGLDKEYLENVEKISRKFLNEAVAKSKQNNKK